MSFPAIALAAHNTSGVLAKQSILRRSPLANDVLIKILFSGICHSDVHQLRAEWSGTFHYPMVPGHEIVGEVEAIGDQVTKWKIGQKVGVGVFVDSCRTCEECQRGLQQYCHKGCHFTYNHCLKNPNLVKLKNCPEGELLFGGYSSHITVDENYVVSIPEGLPLDSTAPLLCAGITVYSPLRHFGQIAQTTSGSSKLSVGVAGFGGLGNAAVKMARAMGHHVTVISRSKRKEQAALAAGAHSFLVSDDAEEFRKARRSMHLIIDTIAANHDIVPATKLLKVDGIYCIVGLPPDHLRLYANVVVGSRLSLVGSNIGGIPETQEMLNFCAQHGITSDIKLIDAKDVNHAIRELASSEAEASRFVIRTADTLVEGDWDVEPDSAIDPVGHIHQEAVIVPPSANATLKRSNM